MSYYNNLEEIEDLFKEEQPTITIEEELEILARYNWESVLSYAVDRLEEVEDKFNQDLNPPNLLPDDPFYDPEKEAVRERIELEVVHPKENELQLDIDTEEGHKQFELMYKVIGRIFGFEKPPMIKPSKSGTPGKYHITCYLTFNPTDIERLLLQSLLGSDPKREAFNFYRLKELGVSDSCFFERKEK